MKKMFLISFPIAFVMIIILGCGGGGNSTSSNSNTGVSSTSNTASSDYSFSETVLYSDDDLDVTLTGYSENGGSPEINIMIVNKSDNDYQIDKYHTAINGITQYGGTDELEIAAGKTLNSKIKFRQKEFELAEFPTIYNIAIKIDFKTKNNSKLIETDFVTLNLRTGNFSYNDELIYEDDKLALYKISLSNDMRELKFRVHNKKDYPIIASVEGLSVNDNMCTVYPTFSGGWGLNYFSFGGYATPDYDTVGVIYLDDNTLSEKGISDVNTIEFKINGLNYSTFIDDGSGYTDPIVISK